MTTRVNQDSSVTFHCHSPHSHQVFVCASFNNWQHLPLQRHEGGHFVLTTPPLGGIDFSYKFVVDGHYVNDAAILRTDHGTNSWLSITGAGTLIHESFWSESLNEYKKYVIYLPPGYFISGVDYPLLYLCGGLLDWEMSWHQRGYIEKVADELIRQGRILPMVIVMPDKSQEWTEEGRQFLHYNYMVSELSHVILKNYRIDRRKIGMEGLSIGAWWAAQIAFRNPHLYRSVCLLSCPVSRDLYDLASHHQNAILDSGLRIRLACGDGEESVIEPNFQFRDFLKTLGIPHECYVGSGPHDWELWEKEIYNCLQFHSASFR